jgi:hypothetical protein
MEELSSAGSAMTVLAHDGDAAYEQAYDILINRKTVRPNEVWQVDG